MITVIEKPQSDQRQYRYLKLENELSVLLISDPQTDKSACAVNVNVGHLHDPDSVQGLAHFCEHMLFLGSQKYPSEDEYHQFISKNGGSSNAYTAMEDTNYHFEINKEHLEGALDRMAQFFIAPLFTQSCTDREMQAVHSEHQNNLMSDFWRVFQLFKSTCNERHPFHKFGTGSMETLSDIPKQKGIDVRSALLHFHEQHYSANLIHVVILGAEEMNVLESWAREKFNPIQNKNLTLPSFSHVPVCENEQLSRIFKIVPVKDLKEINIIFPMPSLRSDYIKKPLQYYSHLIGHEGAGSAFAHLKQKGWVTSLSSGPMHTFTDQTFFSIAIEMTDQGEEHYLQIINIIFQYIAILRRQGVQRWIFDELCDLSEIEFRFKEKPKPSNYVMQLAGNMRKYAPEHVISGDYLIWEYDGHLLEETIKWLVPENCIVHYVSKRVEMEDNLQQERWYGTKFTVEQFDQDFMHNLRNASPNHALSLPQRNEFVPRNFQIKESLSEDKESPQLALETTHFKLWHKLDHHFQQPKTIVIYKLITPLQFMTPQNFIMADLFCQMIMDRLNEFAYFADIAGLKYQLQNNGDEGISLTLRGFSEKLPLLRRRIFEAMKDYPSLKRERFEILKENLYRQYRNHLLDEPYYHVLNNEKCAFNTRSYALEDLVKVIPEIDFETHFTRFMPVFFMSLQIEALFHGNVTQQEALDEMHEVEQLLCGDNFGLLPSQISNGGNIVKLSQKTDYVYQVTGFNAQNTNSSIGIIYQIGLRNMESDMTLSLLSKILSAKYFDEIRTKQQIGYIVTSFLFLEDNVSALSLLVQSSEYSPRHILEQSDIFMQRLFEIIRDDMSEQEVQEYVQALIQLRQQPDKQLVTETSRHWREIHSRQYRFHRRQAQIQVLKKITKQHLVDFYEKYVLLQSRHCRRLISQVFSTQHVLDMGETTNTASNMHQRETCFVKDLVEFKKRLPLFPSFTQY